MFSILLLPAPVARPCNKRIESWEWLSGGPSDQESIAPQTRSVEAETKKSLKTTLRESIIEFDGNLNISKLKQLIKERFYNQVGFRKV